MTTPWPQRIIDVLGREPQVGDWVMSCCEQDLHQIETQDELEYLRESLDPDDVGDWITGIWATKEEALRQS